MNTERVLRAMRPLVLLALPVAAGFACANDESKEEPSSSSITEITTVETVNGNTRKEDIVKKAKEYGYGVVFVTLENYDPGLDLFFKFERIDELNYPKDEDNEFVHLSDLSADYPGGPINTVFAAFDCTGKYQLQWSFNGGKDFEPISLTLPHTQKESDVITFNPDTCAIDVTINMGADNPAAGASPKQ